MRLVYIERVRQQTPEALLFIGFDFSFFLCVCSFTIDLKLIKLISGKLNVTVRAFDMKAIGENKMLK